MNHLFVYVIASVLLASAGCHSMEPTRFKSLGFEDNTYFQANKNGTV